MKRTYDRPSAERLRPLLRSIVREIEEREANLRALESELRSHPKATALVVFTLGVLVGRMLR